MIAICVGHSRPGDRGAVSADGTTEHCFNRMIATEVAARLHAMGVPSVVIAAYEGRTYGLAMTWVARKILAAKAALAVELHFNASDNRNATGHEWLYLTGCHGGRDIARCMHRAMVREFPDQEARGAKAISPADRGAQFLTKTHCPAVLAEPFFGTSWGDWEAVAEHPAALANALAVGLAAAYDILTGKVPVA